MIKRLARVLSTMAGLTLSVLAFLWRRLMFRTTFVAITGSYGKTTATECLGAILASHFQVNWSPGGRNHRNALAHNILRTRPRHRFTVIEVGTKRPGALWRASWMIDPDIAVVLAVGFVHSDYFPKLELVAAEKAQLLRGVRGDKLAVLNSDDPMVRAMAGGCTGRVMTFGRTEQADLWATGVSSRWPSRLSFVAHTRTDSCRVNTNLVGEHWLNSVLAALAVSVACGVKLEDAASALERVAPATGRMQPVRLPNGAVVLRDEFNPSASTMDAALRVLREADAPRRLVVLGDVYDSVLPERARFEDLGRRAALAADAAVFIGKDMRYAANAASKAGMPQQAARVFRYPEEAAEFLRSELRDGDLLLLRGWSQRHLERLYFAQLGAIGCWKKRCERVRSCDSCPELRLDIAAGASPGALQDRPHAYGS